MAADRAEIAKIHVADLLTKHSISQERVNKLAELFDCKLADGRAESAPKLRNAETSKATLGKADELLAQRVRVLRRQPAVRDRQHLQRPVGLVLLCH